MATVCQCVPSGKTGVISRRTDSWPAESNPHTAQQPTDIYFSVFPVGGSTVSQTSPTITNKQLWGSYSYIRPKDYGHVWYQHRLIDILVTFWKTLLPPSSELKSSLTIPRSLLLSKKDNEPSCLAPLLKYIWNCRSYIEQTSHKASLYGIWDAYGSGTQLYTSKLEAEGSSRRLVSLWNLPMGFEDVIPDLQQAEPFLPTAHTCLSGPQLILASWSLGTCSHNVPCTKWPCSYE